MVDELTVAVKAVGTDVEYHVKPYLKDTATSHATELVKQSPMAQSMSRLDRQRAERATRDFVIQTACDIVHKGLTSQEKAEVDRLTGKQSPAPQTVEEAVDKIVEEARSAAVKRSIEESNIRYLGTLLGVVGYVEHVEKFGKDLAAVMEWYENDPRTVLRLAAYPQVQKGAVLYVRTCYAPPKSLRR